MSDTFHSCDITPNGISIKVLRDGVGHRTALGVGDFESTSAYITAVAAILEAHMGKSLAAVAAVISSREDDKAQTIAALEAQHAAEVAALVAAHGETVAGLAAQHAAKVAAMQSDIDALGTTEQAQAIKLELEAKTLRARMAVDSARLKQLDPDLTDAEPIIIDEEETEDAK